MFQPHCQCVTIPVLGAALVLGSSSASPAGMVSGVVREADGAQPPVADARMTLFDPSLTFFEEARTDVTGAYSLDSVPPGTYQLGCAALRFEYVEETVSVGGGGLTRDFALVPEIEPGQWDIIGTTAPEFLDATDIGLLLPDGKIFYCHDTTDPIL
ncbi:MAG: carboxypeptidase-like regulatory domain-containing protein, partial [Planctomycetota bacterium]